MGFNYEDLVWAKMTPEKLLESSKDILFHLRDRCTELEDALLTLDSSKKEILGQIEQCFQTINRCLEDRRRVLVKDLEDSLEKRRILIGSMSKDLEERSQRITVAVEVIKQSRLTANGPIHKNDKYSTYLIENRTPESALIEKLRSSLCSQIPIHPSTSDILSYFPIDLDQLLSLIKNFGAIGITNIDADQTTLERHLDENASSYIKCSVEDVTHEKIKVIDCRGRDVKLIKPEEFSVSLIPRLPMANEASIVFDGNNQGSKSRDSVSVRLKLYYPGFYDCNIKVLGEHIRGSPFKLQCVPLPGPYAKEWKSVFQDLCYQASSRLNVRHKINRSFSARLALKPWNPLKAIADKQIWDKQSLLFAIGGRGRGPSEFGCPQGAWVTRDLKILVADSSNANIQVFNSSGALINRFGEFGAEPGQMVRPNDVAETINSNYLICDFDAHCIHVFQPSGKYMSRFGQRNLAGPNAVAVDSKGRIFVADLKACVICYFKPTGRYLGQFGSRGPGDSQFLGPSALACDSLDRVYVSDSPVHCIKVFENEGDFLYRFGAHGPDPGNFHTPSFLCFDARDRLYVSDTGNNRIQVFDKHGQFVGVFFMSKESLNEPHGIAVSFAAKLLVIVDAGNFRIKAFQLPEPPCFDDHSTCNIENGQA